MKRATVIKTVASFLALIIMLTSCSSKTSSLATKKSTAKLSTKEPVNSNTVNNDEQKKPADPKSMILKPYDDLEELLQRIDINECVLEKNQYKSEDIHTYSYDSKIIFKGSEALASEILEKGKNPGLGIIDLHKQGITGKNVNVAIIDQYLLTDYPEYADRIAVYYDMSGVDDGIGSYHGPSVISILAGKTIGVAPEVNVYYAAVPAKNDAKYYADCLNWIIQQNEKLPTSQKIRVVSVSAAPLASSFKNSELWEKAVIEAQKLGIFIIDCRSKEGTCFVCPSYYDLADKDNISKGKPGFPDLISDFSDKSWKSFLFVPSSLRTCAQEHKKGEYCYRYDGKGGLSWAIPYVSGVMALGWQVNPELSGETMKSLLFQTSWVNEKGLHFINPPAFIEAVRKAH